MANEIDSLKIGSTTYDIDLPPDATPSIASLTTSGKVSVGGDLYTLGNVDFEVYDSGQSVNIWVDTTDDDTFLIVHDEKQGYTSTWKTTSLTAERTYTFPNDSGTIALTKNIPTVNNGTLTIQGNGTAASTFTANQSGNTTLNVKGSGITIVTRSAADEITIESKNLVETTWTNLKSLRDSSQLVPGRFYRITDYTCTTITTNTSSAGHVFDIIVLALENNKLSEEAWAALHSGDTYFASNNLSAWKLWYCLDNDTNRFAWADSTNGKGVIYRMIDEFENDVSYDFKNILFTDSSETPKYTSAYTFNYIQSGAGKDASLLGTASKSCHNNIIKKYINSSSRKQELNFNVFCSRNVLFNCLLNTFDEDCYSNTFGRSCFNNVFGNVCHHNTFGENCHHNIFSCGCTGNTFNNSCDTNIFSYGCANNTFGKTCQGNTFGTTCISNTFGNICISNRFSNNCRSNIFGNACRNNTFGNGCQGNIFGDTCFSNTFGNDCYDNTFGRNCSFNKFNSGCASNTFGDSSSTINACVFNELDNGCSFLYINESSSTSSSSDELQNIHIHSGVSGTSTEYKTITVDRGLSYSIDVYPVGSTELFI